MSGEMYAIACAVIWALSSALVKSQSAKMHIVTLGALRTAPAVVLYWSIVFLSGRAGELVRLPLRSWIFLVGSALVGLVLGDLMYFKSMKLIGLSRAMPLSTTYPFITMLLAFRFLDEQIGWPIVVGASLIAVGAYLIIISNRVAQTDPVRRRTNAKGVALAVGTAVCWGVSTVLSRAGLEGVDVAVANSVRLSVLMLALLVLSIWLGNLRQIREQSPQTLGIVVLAGAVGIGLGTFAFLTAVQLAGAARTSILTATTPLFGVPLSLVLRERPSPRTLLGTLLTVVGVGLTVY